ncbi:MAG: hypothetical protein JWQ48_2373 [Conexibacter sp.]|nr:hypothetical protein [Conexibacter sp.]
MNALRHRTRTAAIAIAIAIALPAMLVAAIPGAAAAMRRFYGFTLKPSPGSLHQAAGFFLTNGRTALVVLLGATLTAALPHGRRGWLIVTAVLDAAIVIALGMNLVLVGGALGAYGLHGVRWMPHLPLEAAGITVAIAVYLEARTTRRLTIRSGVAAAAVTLSLLAIAALVESYLAPGGLAG